MARKLFAQNVNVVVPEPNLQHWVYPLGSFAQSAPTWQKRTVLVALHEKLTLDVQLAWHVADQVLIVHIGGVPPATSNGAQQTWPVRHSSGPSQEIGATGQELRHIGEVPASFGGAQQT